MGGTGKTPHVEYLLYLLQYLYKTATLSRGYGRKSHGFILAQQNSTALEVGDEPLLYKLKFPDAIVTVGEDRVMAVPQILHNHPETDAIILDDAFQHRAIKPGLSILLTEYSKLFTRDSLFPVGWLREHKENYHRADIIVVTKCPTEISDVERREIIAEINPFRYQHVYFSSLNYHQPYMLYNTQLRVDIDKATDVLLLCGIANFEPLKLYLQEKARSVFVRDFRDHHTYDEFDLDSIRQTYTNMGEVNKVIITTEKDAARLLPFASWFSENKIEIFVQPVSVLFLGEDEAKFNKDIFQYLDATVNRNQNQ